MRWLYGFNDDEAIRCFREAARLDVNCGFAWWGIAYASGINVNDTVMSEGEFRDAWEAHERALSGLGNASAVAKALVEAPAQRDGRPPPDDEAGLERACAVAIEKV